MMTYVGSIVAFVATAGLIPAPTAGHGSRARGRSTNAKPQGADALVGGLAIYLGLMATYTFRRAFRSADPNSELFRGRPSAGRSRGRMTS